MTAPVIRVKVFKKSTVKGKMDARFPANINVSGFLTLSKASGNYTLGVDYTLLTPGVSDPTTTYVAAYDAPTGTYRYVPLTAIPLPTMAANTVLGSIAGGTPIALTKTQATTLINPFTSLLSGAVPASGGGTANFLRADGAFVPPTAIAIPSTPQGRLTLTSATPVLKANATAQSTVYYDNFMGSQVPYWTGSADAVDTITAGEVSMAMVSAASAGQVVSGQVYDIWWVHGGANRICIAMSSAVGGGGGWASDTGGSSTARGTGYSQLDLTTRPYITNKNTITNAFNGATNYGPVSANQATYLGTLYATANGQTSMTFTASGSGAGTGGGANVLGLFNAYNRVPMAAYSQDTTSSWTYAVATWRAANASVNNAIKYVDGLAQLTVNAQYGVGITSGAGNGAGIGINRDSTSANPTFQGFNWSNAMAIMVRGTFLPSAGLHTINAVETAYTAAPGTQTFYGSGWGGNVQQTQNLQIELAM
jgi:hypothetical protein